MSVDLFRCMTDQSQAENIDDEELLPYTQNPVFQGLMSDKGLFAKSEWHRSKLSPSHVKFIPKISFRWVFSQAARHPEQD